MRRVIFAAIMLAACTSETPTKFVIHGDPGGFLFKRHDNIAKLQENEKRVEIKGQCDSACTMYLGLGDRVCIKRGTMFGFHSAYEFMSINNGSQKWTKYMVDHYPEPLQDWFWENVGSGMRYKYTYLSAEEIMEIVPNTYRYCD
jgi:hypothetical protein